MRGSDIDANTVPLGQALSERALARVLHDLASIADSGVLLQLLTEDRQHFSVTHVHSSHAEKEDALRKRFEMGVVRALETDEALNLAVTSRRPCMRTRTAQDPGSESASTLLGGPSISSMLVIPLHEGERVLGAVTLLRCDPAASEFDERDVSRAQDLAEYAALALMSTQLSQTSRRDLAERDQMSARLELLAELSKDFAEATSDYHRLLDVVARRLSEVIGELCVLRGISDDGLRFEDGAIQHADPEIVTSVVLQMRQSKSEDGGIACSVVSSGRRLFLPRFTPADWVRELPRFVTVLERLDAASAMMVPLLCREKAVGVVTLVRSANAKPYTQDDLKLLEAIAEHAALAIANARSYRAEHASRQEALRLHDELQKSEQGHRLLFEATPVPMVAYSTETLAILAANAAAQREYGYSQDEMLRLKIWELRTNPDEAEARAALARAGERDLRSTLSHRRKDGSTLEVDCHSKALSLLGHPARLAVALDVSARHEADSMRALLSAIVRSSGDAIVSADLNGIWTSWNPAAERLFGYTSVEAMGKSLLVLIPEELRSEGQRIFKTVLTGQPISNHETVRLRKDGSPVHVSLSVSPIRDATGAVVGVSTTLRDLTQQLETAAALKKTEDLLRQAQKTEAVGKLAGGIAHDFNNALSVIMGCGGLVMQRLPTSDPNHEDVEEMCAAAQRAADLTRQLLMFSRQQVVVPRVLDLNRLLEDMKKMLRRVIREEVELVWSPHADAPLVLSDPSQLDQVLLNLVVNGRDAMPRGGRLSIETANVTLDADYVREHPEARPGAHVMLAVSDTGHGMDAETRSHIFEPFFTTKEPGKGTGLGLATVLGIVHELGGSITVESELGRGTTFRAYFPLADSEPEPQAVEAPHTLHGPETVLLVEDQDEVRNVAREILEHYGYRVISASSPREALALSTHHAGELSLLLTDVVMPELSGQELAMRVCEQHPDIKVLYISGHVDDDVLRRSFIENQQAFLQKPFSPQSLASQVREVLDGSHQSGLSHSAVLLKAGVARASEDQAH